MVFHLPRHHRRVCRGTRRARTPLSEEYGALQFHAGFHALGTSHHSAAHRILRSSHCVGHLSPDLSIRVWRLRESHRGSGPGDLRYMAVQLCMERSGSVAIQEAG